MRHTSRTSRTSRRTVFVGGIVSACASVRAWACATEILYVDRSPGPKLQWSQCRAAPCDRPRQRVQSCSRCVMLLPRLSTARLPAGGLSGTQGLLLPGQAEHQQVRDRQGHRRGSDRQRTVRSGCHVGLPALPEPDSPCPRGVVEGKPQCSGLVQGGKSQGEWKP